MILFQLNILFILIIQRFGCFAGKFDFIFNEIENVKYLEKIYKKEDWQKIEPEEKLEKCKIKFDISEYLDELKVKVKVNNLFCLVRSHNESHRKILSSFFRNILMNWKIEKRICQKLKNLKY